MFEFQIRNDNINWNNKWLYIELANKHWLKRKFDINSNMISLVDSSYLS